MPTPRRSRDLSHLLTRPGAPTPLSPEQELVGGWITLWLDGKLSDAAVAKKLNAQFWRIRDLSWDSWKVHGRHVAYVLAQAREAEREWREETPRECSGTGAWPQMECDAQSNCGVHRRAIQRWQDVTATFYGELVWGVPTRARASLERDEAERARREVLNRSDKGKR